MWEGACDRARLARMLRAPAPGDADGAEDHASSTSRS
jgi:hypothetical protein